VGSYERGALGLVTTSRLALNQSIAIQHGVYGADRRWLDHGELPQQLVADLPGAPGRVLFLDPKERAFDLKGQLVGLSVGRPATVVESVQATVLVSVIDLVASDSGNTELTAQRCHLLAFEEPGYQT